MSDVWLTIPSSHVKGKLKKEGISVANFSERLLALALALALALITCSLHYSFS